MGVIRDPKALMKTKELDSPVDPDVKFTIKRATNREDVRRANMFAKVRYIQGDADGEVITERDFPVGDLQIATIEMCLVDWNVKDKNEKAVPITVSSLMDYLLPEERVFLYNEILAFNPIWSNREEAKND